MNEADMKPVPTKYGGYARVKSCSNGYTAIWLGIKGDEFLFFIWHHRVGAADFILPGNPGSDAPKRNYDRMLETFECKEITTRARPARGFLR